MNNRRNFLKTSLALSVGVISTSLALSAEDNVTKEAKKEEIKKAEPIAPKGIFYSTQNQERWEGKAGSHAPIITVNGRHVTIETKHGMSEAHYIVKHALLTTEGEVLGEMVFFPKDKKAISFFELKEAPKALVATSFCNLHDLWVTEYSV